MEEDVGSVNMTMYVLPSLRMGHVLVCMYLPKTLYLMRKQRHSSKRLMIGKRFS